VPASWSIIGHEFNKHSGPECLVYTRASNIFTHSTATGVQWNGHPPGRERVASRNLLGSFTPHVGTCVPES
jgi:hypothetical protein